MWVKNKPLAAAKLYLELTNADYNKKNFHIYRFFRRQSPKTVDRLYNYLVNEAVEGENITIKQLLQRSRDWEKKAQADKPANSAIIYDFNEARRRKQ